MKKLLLTVAAAVLLAAGSFAGNRTVTINEVANAVSNRLEQTVDEPKDDWQVWVGLIQVSEYIRNLASPLIAFSDFEIKFSDGNLIRIIRLSTGEIITEIQFKLLVSTFNWDLSLALGPLTNNAVAFYYENRKTQTLTRLRQENFDSLLEQLADEYYNQQRGPRPLPEPEDQYHTAIYCVVDGRIVDPEKTWFKAGNGAFEAHVNRSMGCDPEKSDPSPGTKKDFIWWPVIGKWYEEVPPWLTIPKINYVENGTSEFWEYMRMRKNSINP